MDIYKLSTLFNHFKVALCITGNYQAPVCWPYPQGCERKRRWGACSKRWEGNEVWAGQGSRPEPSPWPWCWGSFWRRAPTFCHCCGCHPACWDLHVWWALQLLGCEAKVEGSTSGSLSSQTKQVFVHWSKQLYISSVKSVCLWGKAEHWSLQ